ncbi:FkbM family methyltransferase [Micrococcus luteus]|uniref:FkbM family methyltransferase n=1 Tax=Micrococcus luteus TaxID=1270 RepID=UPI00352F6AD0
MILADAGATGVARVRSRGGVYDVVVPDSGTDYIQGHLQREGSPYEEEMLDRMAAALLPGDLVIDVGANIGNHTLNLACVADARVVAIEPDSHLADALRRSVELNGAVDRVEVYECAAGAQPGFGRLILHDPANLGTQSLSFEEGDAGQDVAVYTLDDLIQRQSVRMVKIDVEGFELEVLQGGMEMITRDRPLIWVECLDYEAYEAVSSLLSPLGYRVVDVVNASPTLLFSPGGKQNDAGERTGINAVMHRLYTERRIAESLRSKFQTITNDLEDPEARKLVTHLGALAELEIGQSAAEAELKGALTDARRRIAELEARERLHLEDFRAIRGFVETVEDRLWSTRTVQAENEAAAERLRYLEDALELVTTEKEMALAEAGEMRATLRRIRSSRTFRAGRALSEAQSVSGASRALPRLLAIIREEKKGRDV